MGLDINSVMLLLAAHKRGASFKNVLTLGRLSMNVYPARMAALLAEHGLPSKTFADASPDCAYAEPFFKALGAETVDAMDASSFEGARYVHDLNQPLPDAMKEQFDIVFDGGTLEHVFNCPQAFKDMMELARVGGRVFMHTCANNLCGHGFYQFSPELFFRVFSAQNGFEVERMILHRVGPYGSWFEVSDPDKIRERVELITFTPVQMLVQARRVEKEEIFATAPQQSDYVVLWQESGGKPATPRPTWLQQRLPALARLLHVGKLGIEYYRRQSLLNRRYFNRVRRSGH